MSARVVIKFTTKDTVRIWAYTYNDVTGVLEDPTTVTLDLYDPDETQQVDGAALAKYAIGTYYYDYHQGASSDPMDTGKWKGSVFTADGTGDSTKTTETKFSFEVA